METESVRSGRSERSDAQSQRDRSRRQGNGNQHRDPRNGGSHGDRHGDRGDRHHSSRSRSHGSHGRHSSRERRHHRERDGTDRDTDRDDRSVTIQAPVRVSGNGPTLDGVDGLRAPGEERIEVQILPQDDNWGETTTAVSGYTGATSETGFSQFSVEDMSRVHKDLDESIGFNCARYIGTILAGILGVIAFISPIVMVILPKLGLSKWSEGLEPCRPECEGLCISFGFKLLILLIGSWALFFREPKATMPRIFIFRALVLSLVFILTFAFWLFYGVRIYESGQKDYHSIVMFAASFVDALLFIHYLAVILLEIRQLQPMFVVKIVRSPDGASSQYTVGQLSIQRLAAWCLEQYYKDFEVYNPYLEHIPRRAPRLTGFKFYDVDGPGAGTTPSSRSRAIIAAAARGRDSSHNDRFYEEQEYERRVRKRKARLIVAAEEAFTHIKRMQEEAGPAIPMDPQEAAQSIFPSLARALQKFLRITRQQPRYTMENILEHLATCIGHDMSPKSFLERYLSQGPCIWNDKDYRKTQTWVLVCDQLLSRAAEHGTLFQLRQGDVSLLISVRKLPHFNLTEEVIDPKTNKFVLRLNSETSV